MSRAERGRVEVRVEVERAVLADPAGGREMDPRETGLAPDLAEALHEWARVAGALRRTADGEVEETSEAAAVVSRRGRQLAARIAETFGVAVSLRDPVTGAAVLVHPRRRRQRRSVGRKLLGTEPSTSTPTPWGTGLIVAVFIAVVAAVAILALARTLAAETTGWLALAATVVVTAGLTPSLWLGRKLPILRWVVLGAAAGVVFAWIGVVVIVL